jgi:hypothetical protein
VTIDTDPIAIVGLSPHVRQAPVVACALGNVQHLKVNLTFWRRGEDFKNSQIILLSILL